MGRNIGNYRCVSITQCLHDVVVEDLLWNSLDGNVLKQRAKDRSLEDLLRQKGHIGEIRVQTYPPENPASILKNETEGPFPISLRFIHLEIMAEGRS